MRRPRRNHNAAFKARVALEAIRGEKTVAVIAAVLILHVRKRVAIDQMLRENAGKDQNDGEVYLDEVKLPARPEG